MDAHEYAQLFPLATDEEIADMAADIKTRGLLNPIVTLDGLVLDGRNRLRACELAGVTPRFIEYSGTDPLGDVLSWNLHRRQLSTSQRAALAVAIKPIFEKQAKERQVAALKKGDVLPVSANLRQRTKGKSAHQAAAAVGVSGRTVEDAELIKREAPEAFEEIKAGRMTVHAAKEGIKEKEVRKERARDPLDTTQERQTPPEDNDSSTLYHLKRFWRIAKKKDRQQFKRWINENVR